MLNMLGVTVVQSMWNNAWFPDVVIFIPVCRRCVDTVYSSLIC